MHIDMFIYFDYIKYALFKFVEASYSVTLIKTVAKYLSNQICMINDTHNCVCSYVYM